MTTAKCIVVINSAPKIEISNVGTMTLIGFADILYHSGRITLKLRNQCRTTAISPEFATKLVNDNLDLFPSQF